MKIDKYWLFKVHTMAEEGEGDGGGDGGDGSGGDGSMLPAGGGGGDGSGDGSGDGDGAGDGSGGDGDQEWFLKDKYKTVEDQAKAYPELQKKLGESAKLIGAPEGDYELSMPEGLDGEVDTGNPLLDTFMKTAKDMNMSQEAFNNILHAYIQGEAELTGSSVEQEMKALGDNADRRLKDLADFGSANLDKDTYEAFRAVASTAAGVQVLEAMKGLTREHKMPGNDLGIQHNKSGHTPESLKEMLNKKDEGGHRLVSTDPAYKKKVDKAYNDYYGSEPVSTVMGA